MVQLIGAGLQGLYKNSSPVSPFRPRAPWFGGDLQTLRNRIVRRAHAPLTGERVIIPVGEAGALALAHAQPQSGNGRALLLVHGLGGDETSDYMIEAAHYFLGLGYEVYRLNLRGTGPSKAHSVLPYHAGLSEDVVAVLHGLSNRHSGDLVALGFSLGGHVLLRTVATQTPPGALKAAISVSAPLDLARCQRLIERVRNRPYRAYLAHVLKAQLEGLEDERLTSDPASHSSVRAVDDHVIAPLYGFRDADDYYAQMSVKSHLGRITCPTLAIHSVDDPWIAADDYREADWPTDQPVGALLSPGGGHVGFHDRTSRTPWYLSQAEQFLNLVFARR